MKAAVIGGGFAGLVAALAFRERGHDVCLFERRGILGGRATSYSDAATGDEVDCGVHFLLEGWGAALGFLRAQDASGFLRHGLRWPAPPLESARLAWLRQQPEGVDPAILDQVQATLTSGPGSAQPVLFSGGLGRVHDHLARRLRACGGQIRTRALVERIDVERGRVRRVRFLERPRAREDIRAGRSGTREALEVDCAVSAVPWHALAGMLDDLPGGIAQLNRLSGQPAVAIEAWLDGVAPIEPIAAAAFPGLDWIVDRSRLEPPAGALQHLAFSVTPREAFRDRPNAEWVALARRALEATVAPAKAPPFQRTVVLREPVAYYPLDAESSRLRAAAAAAAIDGLFLAGDWTVAELPACIEGAIRSGLRAAEEAHERALRQ